MSGHATVRDTKEYWHANNPELIESKKKEKRKTHPLFPFT